MKKSLLLFALLALVLPLSAFAQLPAPAPVMTQPAVVAAQPAAVPQIDWAAVAGTSPLTIPEPTSTASPFTLQLNPIGWCSRSCTPCPCSVSQGLCRPFACIGDN